MKQLFFLAIVFSLYACQSNVIYQEKKELSSGFWIYDEEIDFSFEVQNIELGYDLVLDVYHEVEFGYQNLYTTIETTYPDGKQVIDTVSFQLSTPQGQWKGKCNSNECSTPIALQNAVKFPEAGTYKLAIKQHSRTDSLRGINGLTLSLIKKQ